MWLAPPFWLGAFPSVPAQSEGSFLSLPWLQWSQLQHPLQVSRELRITTLHFIGLLHHVVQGLSALEMKIIKHVPYCTLPGRI